MTQSRNPNSPGTGNFCTRRTLARLAATAALWSAAIALAADKAPTTAPASASRSGDWPMWAGRVERNLVSGDKGLPEFWDTEKKTNIVWAAQLGSQTFGNPVVAGGKVFIGTNNGNPRNPKFTEDQGVLMCFAERDGRFLWQAVHDKLPRKERNDWPEIGICSAPAVLGDRAWYVSNRGELVCVDTEGFLDKENDGSITDEPLHGDTDADFIWKLDMVKELGVVPLHASASCPLVLDGRVFVVTANGADPSEGNVPAPAAPSFIAADASTGKVIWQSNLPGENIIAGQWSSPAAGQINGQWQVVFPGGDGWVYAFRPDSGELIWKFNAKSNETVTDGVAETINQIVSTPVVHENKVYIAVGQDPESGDGDGCLWCIDATKTGDLTATGAIWKRERRQFGRSISTVAVADGLLYAAELGGYLQCLEAPTGKPHWRYDLKGATWSSPVIADGRVYIGNTDGVVTVLAHGRELKKLAENDARAALYGTITIANQTIYLVAGQHLYAIRR